jgi:hypothetical protein
MALLLCSVAFVGPAAAVNIPGCGEFVIVGQNRVVLESGPLELTGNIIVAAANGFLEVGRFNIIHGTVSANTIKFGNDARVDGDPNTPEGLCEFNISQGVDPATVCDATAPFVFPTCVPDSLFTAPTVDPCVGSAPNFSVPAGMTATLPAGACVGLLTVGNNATLNVSGTINARQIQLGTMTTVSGPATINVRMGASGGAGSTLEDLTLNFAGASDGAVTLGNNIRFVNTFVNVPVGGVHIRMGSVLEGNSEILGRRVIIEPITNVVELNPCPCIRTIAQSGTTLTLTGEEFIFNNQQVVASVLATTGSCDPAAGTAVPFTVNSDTQVTVDVSGLAPGTYGLITTYGFGTVGSCCTLPRGTFTR